VEGSKGGGFTFQCCVECKTSHADEHVTQEGDYEDLVVVVSVTVCNSFEGEDYEEGVCEGVDDFGRVDRRVVVLVWSVTKQDEGCSVRLPLRTSSVST